jgi:sugar (pentulose or hexulose) kinase
MYYPRPGWVELDMAEVWQQTQECIHEALGSAGGDLAGVPVASVLGDQQASLFGHTCFDHGDMKNTYGTGAFLLFTLGNEPLMSKHGLVTTVAWKLGAGSLRWARTNAHAVSPPGERVSIGRSTWRRGSRTMLERTRLAAAPRKARDSMRWSRQLVERARQELER